MSKHDRELRLLFIGNSHTYFNDMAASVRSLALADGRPCRVTMLAHGGWFLAQHVQDPEARFNILYGGYDYVILQEHTHPFAPEDKYMGAVADLARWCCEAGAKPVIYATWAMKTQPELQPEMNALQARAAASVGALLANVGEEWWAWHALNPEVELYFRDGAHASEAGSALAARVIWRTIREDAEKAGE